MTVRLTLRLLPLHLALAACGDSSNASHQASKVPIEHLQEVANKACECKMMGGSIEQCDHAFNEETSGLEMVGYGTSSFPMTGEGFCFADFDDQCVSTGIYLVDGDVSDAVCTEEQATQIEAAVMAEWEKNGQNFGPARELGSRLISKMRSDLQNETKDN